MVNDLPLDHPPVVLRFDVGNYQLDLPKGLTIVNWDYYVYVLENVQGSPAEIHSADGVFNSSIWRYSS